jgi:phosphatidylserine decarboxylase
MIGQGQDSIVNCMAPMHWRTLLKRPPFYENSRHIVTNERTVTNMVGKYKGETLSYYVVQIAGRSVNGIDSYFNPEEKVRKGEVFGMIRIKWTWWCRSGPR